MKIETWTAGALGNSVQLRKLVLSPSQEFTFSTDGGPPKPFWAKDSILMNGISSFLEHISTADLSVQEDFWNGSIHPQILEAFPGLSNYKPAQVVEYCRIMQSRGKACKRLIIRARGERLCPKGTNSRIGSGDSKLVQDKYVLNEAAKSKSVNCYALPGLIEDAAKQNNVRFFIRLGKVLQSKNKAPDVDWTRCDPVACFLVENWCEKRSYTYQYPPLCFFSDLALADFCSMLFCRKPGNPSIDSIRQWRRRLGLKKASSPKISRFILKGNEVSFVEDRKH